MRFLFIDGWADYSNIFNDYRDNSTNSVFLLYASAFKKINKDTFYINASEKDFNKEKLYKFIEEKKIEVAIFYSNIDNILPLLRLDLNNFKTKIDVIFLSINENLSYLLNGKSPQNVIYNEKYSLIENINILLNKFNLHFDNNQYNLNTDFSLIRNIQEKTITINTGTGCKGKCKYCNINDSKILYRSLDIIIEDIRTVLSLYTTPQL